MAKMLERHYTDLMRHIPPGTDVPAIDITGAARWFLEESDKAYWDFSEDFPVVVPPFPFTWLEFSPPKTINEGGRRTDIPQQLDVMGCMAFAGSIPDELGQEAIVRDPLRMLYEDALKGAGVPLVDMSGDAERYQRTENALRAGYTAKWMMICKLYFESRGRIHDLYTLNAYLDPTGKIIPELHRFTGNSSFFYKMGAQAANIGAEMFPFLFALSLMHAKNVTLDDIPIPSAVAKKRAKHAKPVLQFKTLNVHPMRRMATAQAGKQQPGTKYAMHLCRGHFKDFRNGKGLFGKYKGLYWWDMHVRGDSEQGQIIKDYKVEPA